MTNSNTVNGFAPPVCPKHECPLVLYVYSRPFSPAGNGWGCPECAKERESIANGSLEFIPTRFPEGSEL